MPKAGPDEGTVAKEESDSSWLWYEQGFRRTLRGGEG